MSVCLYRHYDGSGNLLYVGISYSVLKRLSEHSNKAFWFPQIRRIEIEHYTDRKAAVIAERRAIDTENPKYNLARPNIKKPKPVQYEKIELIIAKIREENRRAEPQELESIREALGHTKRSLAAVMGIHYRTLQDYCYGKVRIKDSFLQKILDLKRRDQKFMEELQNRLL